MLRWPHFRSLSGRLRASRRCGCAVAARGGNGGRSRRENGPPGSRSRAARDPSGRAWTTSRGGCENESYAVSDSNERPKPERSRSAAAVPATARGICLALGPALAAAWGYHVGPHARRANRIDGDRTRPDQASAQRHFRYHRFEPTAREPFHPANYPKGFWRRARRTVKPPQSVMGWSSRVALRWRAP